MRSSWFTSAKQHLGLIHVEVEAANKGRYARPARRLAVQYIVHESLSIASDFTGSCHIAIEFVLGLQGTVRGAVG